ncbi:hypothetical protein K6Q96_09020 [Grimontia kaedaensis]|uniref:Uncharacterized protein n=1 Tax=Grimontia kaedaensis TaxID=2872157 RepID=A0ABY4WNE1_9GAMM|nr:hypothetical protein [Grimontia kaedaensis]USH01082.1 hypothetical protein K6Q96_09020 [Grimontia kaedaensis]
MVNIKVSGNFWDEVKSNKLSTLSAFGSISSIVALAMVFLDSLGDDSIEPALMGWRIIFFFISIIAITGLMLCTYYWAKAAYKNPNNSDSEKVLAVTWRTILGLLITGIAVDGLFAVIYWTPWMWSFVRLLEVFGFVHFT